MLVAISNKKCIGYELFEKGSVNAERFNKFLKKICATMKNKLIILDNGKIHKKIETHEIIEKSGNHLLYTCPYHSRLNTIEQWFNQMKYYMKLDKPQTFNSLQNSLTNSIHKIKEDHYKNYFIYAYDKEYYKNKKTVKSTKYREEKIYKD